MSASSMNLRALAGALAFLAAEAAAATEAAPAPPAPATAATVTASVELVTFAPDPLQAPPTRQIEAAVSVARDGILFARLRAGAALRPLGTDVLGLVEGGVGGTNSWGLVGDVALGLGARQQFTAGDLYVVQDDGGVERATDLGTTLLLATVSAGLGYDLRAVAGVPLQLLVVPRVQLTMPQRDQAAVELGLGVRAGWTF
jgi:hypothetical protein